MPRNSWPVAALFIAALLAPAPARPDIIARYATSATGSERLGLFALSRMFDRHDRDARVVLALRAELAQQGYYFDGTGSRILSRGFWISPQINYDGNINGGTVNDRFGYGGNIFSSDPAATAKSGWVGGLAFGQRLRLAITEGTYLDLSGQGELEYSPKHQIWANRAKISACLRHNVDGWTFVDLCRDLQDSERERGRSHLHRTSISVSQMAETESAYHELTASLEHSDYGYMDQTGISLSLKSAFDHFMPHVSIFLAQPVKDELAYRRRIDAGIRVLQEKRTYGAHVWAQDADGGYFLGERREDLNLGLGFSADLSRATSVEVSYSRNMSTQPFFDYAEVAFAVKFRGFRW